MKLLAKIKRKYKIAFLLLLVLILVVSSLFKMNQLLEPQLMAIAHQQANNAISLLCKRVLSTLDYDTENLIVYRYDEKGNVIAMEYNTKVLNTLLETSLETLQVSLEAAAQGREDPVLNEILYEDGIIYSVPIGYLSGIAFLQDKGYEFKIGMRIFHYVSGRIEVSSEPYGINSSLISIRIVLQIEAEAITAFYTEPIHFEESIPIVVQVVQGNVPDYMPSIQKE